jgi:hypothetical protein
VTTRRALYKKRLVRSRRGSLSWRSTFALAPCKGAGGASDTASNRDIRKQCSRTRSSQLQYKDAAFGGAITGSFGLSMLHDQFIFSLELLQCELRCLVEGRQLCSLLLSAKWVLLEVVDRGSLLLYLIEQYRRKLIIADTIDPAVRTPNYQLRVHLRH